MCYLQQQSHISPAVQRIELCPGLPPSIATTDPLVPSSLHPSIVQRLLPRSERKYIQMHHIRWYPRRLVLVGYFQLERDFMLPGTIIQSSQKPPGTFSTSSTICCLGSKQQLCLR